MATTDKFDRAIDSFYSAELLPLAEKLRANHAMKFLDGGPDASAASYYVMRKQRSMSKADFESGGCSTPEAAASEIARQWADGKGPAGSADQALVPLAAGMAKLACAMRQGDDESSDVSAFVYAMY